MTDGEQDNLRPNTSSQLFWITLVLLSDRTLSLLWTMQKDMALRYRMSPGKKRPCSWKVFSRRLPTLGHFQARGDPMEPTWTLATKQRASRR